MAEFLGLDLDRVRRWLRDGAAAPTDKPPKDHVPGPGHAYGHAHLGPPAELPEPHSASPSQHLHNQPWLPTHGRVDRLRRSERRG